MSNVNIAHNLSQLVESVFGNGPELSWVNIQTELPFITGEDRREIGVKISLENLKFPLAAPFPLCR